MYEPETKKLATQKKTCTSKNYYWVMQLSYNSRSWARRVLHLEFFKMSSRPRVRMMPTFGPVLNFNEFLPWSPNLSMLLARQIIVASNCAVHLEKLNSLILAGQ